MMIYSIPAIVVICYLALFYYLFCYYKKYKSGEYNGKELERVRFSLYFSIFFLLAVLPVLVWAVYGFMSIGEDIEHGGILDKIVGIYILTLYLSFIIGVPILFLFRGIRIYKFEIKRIFKVNAKIHYSFLSH